MEAYENHMKTPKENGGKPYENRMKSMKNPKLRNIVVRAYGKPTETYEDRMNTV